MCIGKEMDDAETLNLNDRAMKKSKKVEILGTWTFHTHIKSTCRKGGQKLSTLSVLTLIKEGNFYYTSHW